MGFFSRLFSRSAADYLAKGDALLAAQRFYEARTVYEDGLQAHLGRGDGTDNSPIASELRSRITRANRSLAEVNIGEAESAFGRGADEKAAEHLELAKSLTDDRELLETVEALFASLAEKSGSGVRAADAATDSSCRSCGQAEPGMKDAWIQTAMQEEDPDMSPQDYYELLIRQLPGEVSARYAGLGDEFAAMYLAASRDDHEKALNLLEKWYKGTDADIYRHEKGVILHRLGRVLDSEACFREASGINPTNPLPRLALALLLIEDCRLVEAAEQLDAMIAACILREQALMLRADVALLAGDSEGAVIRYGTLLATTMARPAAEKLHEILQQSGRKEEAAAVFKKYLGGCRH